MRELRVEVVSWHSGSGFDCDLAGQGEVSEASSWSVSTTRAADIAPGGVNKILGRTAASDLLSPLKPRLSERLRFGLVAEDGEGGAGGDQLGGRF